MTRQLRKKGDIGFSAISVVGGLISPDKIAQIAAASPDAKTAESYACPKGTSLRDEIARYFRIGQAEWQSFSRTESQNFEQCTAFAKALLEGAFGFQSLQGPKRHHDDGHSYTISLEAKNGRIPISSRRQLWRIIRTPSRSPTRSLAMLAVAATSAAPMLSFKNG